MTVDAKLNTGGALRSRRLGALRVVHPSGVGRQAGTDLVSVVGQRRSNLKSRIRDSRFPADRARVGRNSGSIGGGVLVSSRIARRCQPAHRRTMRAMFWPPRAKL